MNLEPIRRVFRDRGHYELAANDSLCADLLAAQPQHANTEWVLVPRELPPVDPNACADQIDYETSCAYVNGWNECRAAMLATAQAQADVVEAALLEQVVLAIASECKGSRAKITRAARAALAAVKEPLSFTAQAPAQADVVGALYYELLYAVACKFPNETRHETALRYIRERESRQIAPVTQDAPAAVKESKP